MAGPSVGEVVAYLRRTGGVVKDEEPACVLPQPAPHGLDHEALVGVVFLRQVQRPGQGGIVGGQGRRFFGPDPPDEGVVGLVAVGVFEGQLGFADAAQAGDGLGEGGRLAGGEGFLEGVQEVFPPGKVGVAEVGEVPDGGEGAGEAGSLGHGAGDGAGEAGCNGGFDALLEAHPREQAILGRRLVQIHQVNVDDCRQQALQFALPDAHRQEGAFFAGGVLDKGGGPFGLGIECLEVVGRKDGDGALGFCGGLVHLQHKVGAGAEVPGLEDGGVAGFFQLPGDPFGPLAVGAVVADEEVFHGRLLVLGHTDFDKPSF